MPDIGDITVALLYMPLARYACMLLAPTVQRRPVHYSSSFLCGIDQHMLKTIQELLNDGCQLWEPAEGTKRVSRLIYASFLSLKKAVGLLL
jgi:hypothetical protein